MREHYEFQDVHTLTAGWRGQPGSRTFYLLAGQETGALRVWMEKGQLQALGEAIDELIERLPERRRPRIVDEAAAPDDGYQPAPTEFRAQTLALGYDRERRKAVILINEHIEDTQDDAPEAQTWATLEQMKALSRRILTVIASGRQNCPLCGLPIDPGGHVCPRTNGHHPALKIT